MLLPVLVLVGATLAASGPDATKNTTQAIVAKKLMIEAGEGISIESLKLKIEATGARVLKTFDSEVFKGLSIETEASTNSLQADGEVRSTWSVGRIQLPPITPTLSLSRGAANYSVHEYTGVAKCHAAGIYGKGVKVAIVDTGTNYYHEALGGGFGPGFKVAAGYDFVGDRDWPNTAKEPDSDPIDDDLGHGTHVAGIVAGKSEWFSGVAPEATILSYKVFSKQGGGYTDEDTLIEAFLRAYDDGADAITSSIGGPGGFTDGPWATVASRLIDKGVVVTIAAGNEGQQGPFYASNGSSGKNVLAVASVDASEIAALPFQATFSLGGTVNETTLGYLPSFNPWGIVSMQIIPVSLNSSGAEDACRSLAHSNLNLTNSIALIRRGGCDFAVKRANVAELGAKHFLFYADDQPILAPSTPDLDDDIAMIEAAAGAAIIETVKAGGNVTADFTAHGSRQVGVFNSAGGIPSGYTTWGPTYDMEMKPNIAAPGRNILSTYIGADTAYAVMSGTSMACPYVAGVAALYIGQFGGRAVHGNGFAKQLVDRIVTSGAALPWSVEQPQGNPPNFGDWAPVAQVGAGMINAWKVLNYTTALGPSSMNLGDIPRFEPEQSVEITNGGSMPVTYKFRLQPWAGVDSQSSIYPWYLTYFLEETPRDMVPDVVLPEGTFTVQPGETKTARFTFKYPEYDPAKLGMYSGKILISGSNEEELSVPYLGVSADIHKQLQNSMFTDNVPYQYGGVNRDNIEYFHTYDFNLTWQAQNFPKIYLDLHYGTKELRWDVFEKGWEEKNWEHPPVLGQTPGYVGSVAYYAGLGSNGWGYDPGLYNDTDVTVPFPVPLSRGDAWTGKESTFWWFGKLANGSYIAPGDYYWRIAALYPFGDPKQSDEWHVWNLNGVEYITVAPY
ncbi:serine endopeptidase [Apiospora aurea]|uniref:Serine endopeptidase n=1 Tax=Apiospora aurea TaxID=335848 RepID=A0ABR1QI70_9PEZI